jgi:hypothetical protein
MRSTIICIGAAALLAVSLAQAGTFRCGSKLVNEGDRPFEVLDKCGEPAHRDQIGYTVAGYDRREYVVEEWVYGPKNGMLSILRFEANRLMRIETRRAN